MKKVLSIALALSGIMLSGVVTAVAEESMQDTYLGKIQYQDQTITKASAAQLNRQIDLQRASQLALWAMPLTSFYQSYTATKTNLGLTDDGEPVIGLYEGYDLSYC